MEASRRLENEVIANAACEKMDYGANNFADARV